MRRLSLVRNCLTLLSLSNTILHFLRSVYSFYIIIQNIIKKVKYKLAKGKRPVKRISQFAFEIVQFLKIELHSTFKY